MGNDETTSKNQESTFKITARDRFWMNNRLYQFYRFVILNLRILRAVDHSKRS